MQPCVGAVTVKAGGRYVRRRAPGRRRVGRRATWQGRGLPRIKSRRRYGCATRWMVRSGRWRAGAGFDLDGEQGAADRSACGAVVARAGGTGAAGAGGVGGRRGAGQLGYGPTGRRRRGSPSRGTGSAMAASNPARHRYDRCCEARRTKVRPMQGTSRPLDRSWRVTPGQLGTQFLAALSVLPSGRPNRLIGSLLPHGAKMSEAGVDRCPDRRNVVLSRTEGRSRVALPPDPEIRPALHIAHQTWDPWLEVVACLSTCLPEVAEIVQMACRFDYRTIG